MTHPTEMLRFAARRHGACALAPRQAGGMLGRVAGLYVAARAKGRCAALMLSAALLMSACTTSGHVFKADALQHLQPGITTFDQAVAALGASPVNVYRSVDGAFLARWAQKYTWATDAVYWRREALLAFDAQGRFVRQVDGVNVPSRQTDAPAAPSAVSGSAAGKSQTHPSSGPLGGLQDTAIDQPSATYPVRDTSSYHHPRSAQASLPMVS